MTKAQKTILVILSVVAIILGIWVTVLYRSDNSVSIPVEQTNPPTMEADLSPMPATPEPTMQLPIVHVTFPAPYATATPSEFPIIDEPVDTPKPTPAYLHMPTGAPDNTHVPSVPSGMAFSLSILGKTVHVAKDVEEATLEKNPGWLPTSSKPGKEGFCVVYGHRNRNHLLILKEIEVGDEIDVITPDGKVYTYIVDKTEILETNEEMHIPTTKGKHLILMTCYPFHYTGHAPKKFVVTCTLG